MYKIYKTTLSAPVDYAAEELKKYLQMMMTECGAIDIAYDPKAETGFRLKCCVDRRQWCSIRDSPLPRRNKESA